MMVHEMQLSTASMCNSCVHYWKFWHQSSMNMHAHFSSIVVSSHFARFFSLLFGARQSSTISAPLCSEMVTPETLWLFCFFVLSRLVRDMAFLVCFLVLLYGFFGL